MQKHFEISTTKSLISGSSLSMDSKDINELLERYRSNQCTAEEQKTLEQWFDAQSASGEWEWTSDEEDAAKTRIKQRVDQKLLKKSFNWRPLLRVAAVLTILLGSLLYFKTELYNWVNPVVMLEKTVKDGEKFQLTLTDGTKVWLNSGSKLSYPVRFDKGKRQVFLEEGEAYFDVSHDPENPFIVTSGQVSTKVLGTAFNVKAYSFLSSIKIAVTRGKVRVSNTKGESTLLLPNQEVAVDKQLGSLEKRTIDAKSALVWQHGGFAFSNDTMLDVCAVLSKKFHVEFKYGTKDIQDYRLTAGFEGNDQITDILSILASANNLTFVLHKHTFTFNKK